MSEPGTTKTVILGDVSGGRHEVSVADLQWRPATYGVVIKDDAILLLPAHGGYSIPGGGVELGESLEEGLLREVFEETGAVVANPKLLGVESNFFIIPYEPEATNKVQSILLYYRCEYVSGELSKEGHDEGEQIFAGFPEWVPLSKLPEIKVADSIDWRKYILELQPTE